MNSLKDERGSITLFVLIAMLFFVLFLVGMYMLSANSESSQIAEVARIKEIYEQGVNNIDDVYETLVSESNEKVNAPKLVTGMTPIKWEGTRQVTTTNNDTKWYDYVDKSIHGQSSITKWANAITEDGSMWVWIPRYAYKITYYTDSNKQIVSNQKTQYRNIDIIFLKEATNCDFNGNDVTKDNYVNSKGITGSYIVHPAFKDGTRNNFQNGEWDEEITGFWVAKFEAGYEVSNKAKESEITLKTINSNNGNTETSITNTYYGERIIGDAIKYPVFKPNRPSMNYLSLNDTYNLCLNLNANENPYGFTNSADSHLTKNSEWEAVVYLTKSKYGRNGEDVTINNISVNGQNTIYAITGYGAETKNAQEDITRDISTLTTNNQNGSWSTNIGQLASSTGNIYGIYDLNGGLAEWTAGYIIADGNYNTYGGNLKGDSTKYKNKYQGTFNIDTENYGANDTADNPFSVRGGKWRDSSSSGILNFSEANGSCYSTIGFRSILVVE